MSKTIYWLMLSLPLLCCDNPSQSDKTDTAASLYQDTAAASFEITKKDSLVGVEYRAVDVRYQVEYIAPKGEIKHYLAKYITTTQSCTGCEGQARSMAVEIHSLEQPGQTICTIRHDCDEVILEADYYKTVKHGCCGAEDELALFDYDNKPIIEGDGKLVLGNIPNSKLKLWFAYKRNYEDTTSQGTIYLSYSSAERYEIKISTPPLPTDHCNPYTPEMTLRSTDPRDEKIEGRNEYDLWSLDGQTDISKIDHLTLKIAFECEKGYGPAPVEIPVIDGKPFGKAEKKQTVALEVARK